jgi:hypothetical protein
MTKHTPGPWKYYDSGLITAGDGYYVAEVNWDGGLMTVKQTVADMHLIAAAPLLLEACKLSLEFIGTAGNVADEIEAIRTIEAAIAAAEGES